MATALYIEKATNTVDLAHFQIYAYLHIFEHSFNTRLHIFFVKWPRLEVKTSSKNDLQIELTF